MKRGFYTIMAAQFFSSLADNALFVAAVEMIKAGGGVEFNEAKRPKTAEQNGSAAKEDE